MEFSLLVEMHRNIDNFIEQGLFLKKEIIIFGSNESAEKMIDYLGGKGFSIRQIIDNNPKKIGTRLCGISVSAPDQYLQPKKENSIILIASRYYPEMLLQLEGMGYKEGLEVLKVAEYSQQHANSLTEQEFEERVKIIKRGQKVYKKIFEAETDVEKVFISPPGALGDIYIAVSFLKQYLREHDVKKFRIIVRNMACKKVTYLFGFEEQTIVVNKEEMELLLQYAVFTDMDSDRILVMSHRYPYTCRVGEIGNYKNINFVDHFQFNIFQLDSQAKMEIPHLHKYDSDGKKYVDSFFEENSLCRNNTVILFPYANTAPTLNLKFWKIMAEQLISKGFCVCTNCDGEVELPVLGTTPARFDLRYALEVVETAGYMIALRSGICDVLSTAKAKKVILYPDRIYGLGTFIDFYSLKKLGLCDDVWEYLLTDDLKKMNEVADEIVANIN